MGKMTENKSVSVVITLENTETAEEEIGDHRPIWNNYVLSQTTRR